MGTPLLTLSAHVREIAEILEDFEELDRLVWSQEYVSWQADFATTWERLSLALSRAAAKDDPPKHEGLAAIWLRVVARMAQAVERKANSSSTGYEILVREPCPQLTWLWHVAEYLSRKIYMAEGLASRRIASAVAPQEVADPLDELKRIADLAEQLTEHGSGRKREKTRDKAESDAAVLVHQAGTAILSCLNEGWITNDSKLDEVVLFAVGLDYKAIRPEYVLGALANLWLTGDWQGFPEGDYFRTSGELRPGMPVQLSAARLADAVRGVLGKLRSTGGSKSMAPYEVDLEQSRVLFGGISYQVKGEGARMLHLLAIKPGAVVPMSKNGFTKPSDVKDDLPDPLRNLIDTKSGSGYRLREVPAHSNEIIS